VIKNCNTELRHLSDSQYFILYLKIIVFFLLVHATEADDDIRRNHDPPPILWQLAAGQENVNIGLHLLKNH